MKVLLVDDDQALLTVFETSLSKDGFEVIKAEDGKTGLEMARAQKPDFIFLDQILPDMKGNDVLKALKTDEATKSISVAMLSNFGQQELMQEALAMGAVDYILKYQVDPSDLSNKIKTHTSSAKPVDDTAPVVAPQAIASINVEANQPQATVSETPASNIAVPTPPVAEPAPAVSAPVVDASSIPSAPAAPVVPTTPEVTNNESGITNNGNAPVAGPMPETPPTPQAPEPQPVSQPESSSTPSAPILDMTPAAATTQAPITPPVTEPSAPATNDNTVPNS